MSAGKGRGVVATRDVPTGTLLMVTPPLVLIIKGPLGRPRIWPDMVSELKTKKLTPWEVAWFMALKDGPLTMRGGAQLNQIMNSSSSNGSGSIDFADLGLDQDQVYEIAGKVLGKWGESVWQLGVKWKRVLKSQRGNGSVQGKTVAMQQWQQPQSLDFCALGLQ